MRWGMVINLAKCMRCHACVAACRIEHFLPLGHDMGQADRPRGGRGGAVDVSTYPVRCNQCTDAPCVHACPTEASHKREDGIVAIDSDKCFGCRYCVIACPYQNRTFVSKDKDPGYFPGYRATSFEKKGEKLYPHQRGHDREVQLLRGAHRRRHGAGLPARHRPRSHAGLRQHLPGPGPHLRRPGRPGQQRLQAHPRRRAASSCTPSTAPTRRSTTSTTSWAARRQQGSASRRRRAATSSTSAPWTATRYRRIYGHEEAKRRR